MKIAIVLGTRPEIIKMSPVIRECERLNVDYFILHTGQHYSYNMDKIFFDNLQLPLPKYNLNIGSGTHAEETARAIVGIEKVLLSDKPNITLVEGDTNTVLAGALAAAKLRMTIGHIEAGLRSHDKKMSEEVNRVLTDHVSDYLFAPTEVAKGNLLKEGIGEEKIFVTGNTIVDAVYQNLDLAKNMDVRSSLQLDEDKYFLATIHRQENVDDLERLRNILKGLELVSERFNKTIVYPMHPRTRKRLRQYNLCVKSKKIKVIDPVNYLTFLGLESEAKLILTDSGGVQEEACILRVPCVTLRYNTERPETVDVGANVLAGTNPENILKKVCGMMNKERNWGNPFGDGKSSQRIVRIITESQIEQSHVMP